MKTKKKVAFSEQPPLLHIMFAWSFAYKKSRDGIQWIQCAVDRERFKDRVRQIEQVLEPIIKNKIHGDGDTT